MALGLGLGLNLGARGGGVFNPFTLSPSLWLDASDISSIVSSGGAVSQWTDKSGNGRHATQGTGANQPITGSVVNGQNAIDFNGTTHRMVLPAYFDNLSTKNFTIFAVVRPNAVYNTDTIFSQETAGKGLAMLYTGTELTAACGAWATLSQHTDLSMPQAAHVFTLRKNATEFRILRDGLFGSSKVPSVTGFTATLGNHIGVANGGAFNNYMDGRFCEFLIYEGYLTESQVNLVQNYLGAKWGVTVSSLDVEGLTPPSSFIGRSTLIGFGDSITAGFAGPAQVNDRWLNIIGNKIGATITNAGINSTPMQNTNKTTGSPFANNGRDRYVSTLTGASKKDLVIIVYGANDFGNTAETNWTRALFKSDYQEVITGLLGAGYAATDICLCTIPYIRDYNYDAGFTGANSIIHEDYNLAVRELAIANGCLFADCYTAGKNIALIGRIDSDKLHPNEAGNRIIAEAILRATIITS